MLGYRQNDVKGRWQDWLNLVNIEDRELAKESIERFLQGRRLKLHPRKTLILPTCEPAPFLGYVLMPDGRRRMPEASVARFRHRLRGIRDRVCAGTMSDNEAQARIESWEAHAAFAQTRKLRNAILGFKQPNGKRKSIGASPRTPARGSAPGPRKEEGI